MAYRPVKTPGPDHPIAIDPHPARIVVRVAGKIIAESRAALALREASYPPVFYLPRQDVDMTALLPSDHATYCPYKGQASYWSIIGAGARGADAVWSYETPHSSAAAIREHLAFCPDRVDAIEELPD